VLSAGAVQDLQRFHRALGDVNRLRILNALATEGEQNVTSLIARLRISGPLMSWHLRRLRRAGVIRMTRVGREVNCALDRDRFAELQERSFRMLMNRTEATR
jgi:ArsR family transcriptional regulator